MPLIGERKYRNPGAAAAIERGSHPNELKFPDPAFGGGQGRYNLRGIYDCGVIHSGRGQYEIDCYDFVEFLESHRFISFLDSPDALAHLASKVGLSAEQHFFGPNADVHGIRYIAHFTKTFRFTYRDDVENQDYPFLCIPQRTLMILHHSQIWHGVYSWDNGHKTVDFLAFPYRLLDRDL